MCGAASAPRRGAAELTMLAVHDYLVRSGAQLQGHRGRGTRYAFASRARGSACARQSDSRLRSLVFVQYSPALRRI